MKLEIYVIFDLSISQLISILQLREEEVRRDEGSTYKPSPPFLLWLRTKGGGTNDISDWFSRNLSMCLINWKVFSFQLKEERSRCRELRKEVEILTQGQETVRFQSLSDLSHLVRPRFPSGLSKLRAHYSFRVIYMISWARSWSFKKDFFSLGDHLWSNLQLPQWEKMRILLRLLIYFQLESALRKVCAAADAQKKRDEKKVRGRKREGWRNTSSSPTKLGKLKYEIQRAARDIELAEGRETLTEVRGMRAEMAEIIQMSENHFSAQFFSTTDLFPRQRYHLRSRRR